MNKVTLSNPARFSCKEDEVVRDLSMLFCSAKSEKTKRTVFWLPATDEQIEKNETLLTCGAPVVAPNGQFYSAFPEYWKKE